MNSYSLPTASTPRPADDTEVLSQRIPGQGEVVLETPQGETPDVGLMAGKIPMEFDEGGRSKLGPQPDTAPEPPMVPDSDRRPPSKRGKTPMPVTSVHPEAPDDLLGALCGASIDEEHRTIMSAVIKKVQSAKSRLTEACAGLLTGFDVRI